MAFFSDQTVLPGVITEIISDYTYGYDTSKFGTTDSVVIVGTAFNGPVGKVVPIYSPEHAQYVFGRIYDPVKRQEASLVAEALDAWDRGCRTIYAVRASGKEIYKEFDLRIDTNLKLRVSGMFPSDANKDVYFTYNNTPGDIKIKFYKPATRATIQEKMEGLVEKENSILTTTINLTTTYGLSEESRLVEVIRLFNENQSNNVLKLSIVNEKGIDVTLGSKEAQALPLRVLFPGAYFIGRNKNLGSAITDIGYDHRNGELVKKIILNSDINEPYPIYAKTVGSHSAINILNSKLPATVKMASMFDFLEVFGKVDNAFGKDNIDYEEVEITPFDLYQKLGSGYAYTAKVEPKDVNNVSKGYRRIAVPSTDSNQIQPITDGIYSMLENLNAKYRILAGVAADQNVENSLPKLSQFKIVAPKEFTLLKNSLKVVPVIDKKAEKFVKEYQMDFIFHPYFDANEILENLYSDSVLTLINKFDSITSIESAAKKITHSFLAVARDNTASKDFLYRIENGKAIRLDNPAIYPELENKIFLVKENKKPSTFEDVYKLFQVKTDASQKYEIKALEKGIDEKLVPYITENFFLANCQDTGITNAYKVEVSGLTGAKDIDKISLISSMQDLRDEEGDIFVGYDAPVGEAAATIKIAHKGLDYTTLLDLTKELNAHTILSKYFTFSIADASKENDDVVVLDGNDINFEESILEDVSYSKFVSGDIDLTTAIDCTIDPLKFDIEVTDDSNATVSMTDAINLIKKYDRLSNDVTTLAADVKAQLEAAFTAKGLLLSDYMDITFYPDSTAITTKSLVNIYIKKHKDGVVKITNTSGVGKHVEGLKLIGFGTKAEISLDSTSYEKRTVVYEDRMEMYDTNLYIPYRTSDNFARHLAQHCTYTSLKTASTHGMIGVSKSIDTSINEISKKVDYLLDLDFDLYAKKQNGQRMLDKNNLPYPIGRNISIVFGQYLFGVGDNYSYITNGAAGYAGMVSILPLDQSSTAQPINIPAPMYEFTNHQLERITQKGFVTFKNSYTQGFVVTDGVTMAPPASPFKRLATTRVVGGIEEAIRRATEPFIGKQNNFANQNALQTAIRSSLGKLKNILIEEYEFNVILDNHERKLGIIEIEYVIVPVFEIKEIRNSLTIKETM